MGDIFTMAGGFFRVLAVLVLFGLLIGGGIAIYNAGVAAGLASDAPAVAPYVGYYGPYWHHGFGFGGFFGFLFLIFGIFLVFGLIRAAFGGGRGWHHRYGDGPGWKGPMGDRDATIRDWHRRLHEDEATPPGSSSSSA